MSFDTIALFKANGPGEGQMADARAALGRDYEVNSRENSYLLNQLAFAYEHGEDLDGVFNRRALHDQLTAPAVTEASSVHRTSGRSLFMAFSDPRQ